MPAKKKTASVPVSTSRTKKTSALEIVKTALALGHSPLPRKRHCFKYDQESGKFWFDSVRNPDVGSTRRINIEEDWYRVKPEAVLGIIELELGVTLE